MYAFVLLLLTCVQQSPNMPTRQEVQGLLDIFKPLVQPFVEQWKRTNDLLEDSREELKLLRDNAASNMKLVVLVSSFSVGLCAGIMGTWFVFSLKHERRLKSYEEKYIGSTVDLG